MNDTVLLIQEANNSLALNKQGIELVYPVGLVSRLAEALKESRAKIDQLDADRAVLRRQMSVLKGDIERLKATR